MPVHLAHSPELESGYMIVAPQKAISDGGTQINIKDGLVLYRTDDEALAHDLLSVGAMKRFVQQCDEMGMDEPTIFIVASDALLGMIGEDGIQ